MGHNLKDTESRLNLLSSTMCLVKWKHATINVGAQTVKSCCHNPSRKIEFADDPLKLHDTRADQRVREDLLNGKKPSDCQYCWAMEETGNYSDRLYWSHQSWMSEFYDEVRSHRSKEALTPSWLEINFSSSCQLKCSYCNPGYSSSWLKEIQEHGAYPTTTPYNDLEWFKANDLLQKTEKEAIGIESFWIWFKAIVPGVRLLTITGGEPLLSAETFKVLDYLIENPQPHLELAVNSNLTLPENVWDRFVEKIKVLHEKKCLKKIYLHPSLDSWGKRAEYIRFGLNLELFQRNLETVLQKTQVNVVFNCTLNNLSLGGLLKYWEYVVSLKKKYGQDRWISSTTEILVFPRWQRINLLPLHFDRYLKEVEDYLRGEMPLVSDHEVQGITRARQVLGSQSDAKEEDYRDFITFFREHDRRRKTNFEETFPELKGFKF